MTIKIRAINIAMRVLAFFYLLIANIPIAYFFAIGAIVAFIAPLRSKSNHQSKYYLFHKIGLEI